MAKQDSQKGNGASKRMSNPKRKLRRERHYLISAKRKAGRVAENKARSQYNKVLQADGTGTPWQISESKRANRREALRDAYDRYIASGKSPNSWATSPERAAHKAGM